MQMERDVRLDDRYLREQGRIYVTGVQALVRLPFDQARRDRLRGLRTGFFVSGYPGSPLGGYDLTLRAARPLAERFDIVHQPGQNEELAATAITGTQMLPMYPSSRYDGVVGIWYGKGPGMDRSGDALRHGNYAGTSEHGAVVVLSGEDHDAKSSTLPIQQEWAFVHAGIPLLYPSSVREFLEYGLHAIALSRFSGCWAGLKLVGQLCDGGETLDVDPTRPAIRLPEVEHEKYQYWRFSPGETVEYERRLYEERHPAVLRYGRANGLDTVVHQAPGDRAAIVTAGKSFADVSQALRDLGLEARDLSAAGVRLVKLGLIYPADEAFIRDAVGGLGEVLVVEEKRGFLEERVKAAIGGARVLGKHDERGAPLFPVHGAMSPDAVAERLGPRLRALVDDAAAARIDRRLSEIVGARSRTYEVLPRRTPNYCSGCPHNVSTRLLPGQEAWGAPGCHVFASIIEQPERHIEVITQLGGEGLPWIGLAPFTDRAHMFQNQGDGGLWHSSYQNIRFAVAAGVSMTFKILFNAAVANTGGQPPVGAADVPRLASMLALEGVRKIAIVTRDRDHYRGAGLPAAAAVHPVEDYDAVVRDLEAASGVTVMLYDGECANERRRQEKRGLRARPTRYVMINEEVCENCGHCGELTNCMSLHKVDTWLGPKTQVHLSSCAQDIACVKGDCPSFMVVDVVPGTGIRKPSVAELEAGAAPEPPLPSLDRPYHVYIPGVGGTGVLTVNAILSWAALIDGRHVMSYDQTGAAQKWGAVLSSIVISAPESPAAANQVGLGRADLYLAVDLMAGSDRANLERCDPSRTAAVVNTTLLPSGEMVRGAPGAATADSAGDMASAIGRHARQSVEVAARELAERLFGDHLAANMIALGVAYQAGFLPIRASAIEAAIELNGVAVRQNLQAFRYGRLWRYAPERLAAPTSNPPTVAEERDRRAVALREWGGDAPAEEYLRFCALVASRRSEEDELTREVVRNLYKLMAYKDEYEVARLHLEAGARARAERLFERPGRVAWLLHPPLLRAMGMDRKLRLGEWFTPGMRALRWLRWLRGTPLDPFGRATVRRVERRLPAWYRQLVLRALDERPDRALEVARLPDMIRGYEQIKLRNVERAEQRAEMLMGTRPLTVFPASGASGGRGTSG
ncbi:MAG TPA: indolepyruvate ferredoxin oxidoreductase family protein [Candidatus Dormibacteraeota bacterium]|jgi:indolepyruvate ferredoxin oxidoreductase